MLNEQDSGVIISFTIRLTNAKLGSLASLISHSLPETMAQSLSQAELNHGNTSANLKKAW
jgi:hypothetical protein